MNFNTQNITTDINQAAKWMQQGKLLAYPTESVWGIGCDPYNEAAVRQILAIKNRPIAKGMIVVTDSISRISSLLEILPESRRAQVIRSWQQDTDIASQGQAHTWLLPLPKLTASNQASTQRQDMTQIPSWICGNHDSVAVRVIHHPLIAELCQKMVSDTNPYGFIVSTSCNPSGEAPAVTLEQAFAYFKEDIGYLQGQTLGYTLPSQIRDAVTAEVIR